MSKTFESRMPIMLTLADGTIIDISKELARDEFICFRGMQGVFSTMPDRIDALFKYLGMQLNRQQGKLNDIKEVREKFYDYFKEWSEKNISNVGAEGGPDGAGGKAFTVIVKNVADKIVEAGVLQEFFSGKKIDMPVDFSAQLKIAGDPITKMGKHEMDVFNLVLTGAMKIQHGKEADITRVNDTGMVQYFNSQTFLSKPFRLSNGETIDLSFDQFICLATFRLVLFDEKNKLSRLFGYIERELDKVQGKLIDIESAREQFHKYVGEWCSEFLSGTVGLFSMIRGTNGPRLAKAMQTIADRIAKGTTDLQKYFSGRKGAMSGNLNHELVTVANEVAAMEKVENALYIILVKCAADEQGK
jgi:hypothetical protein